MQQKPVQKPVQSFEKGSIFAFPILNSFTFMHFSLLFKQFDLTFRVLQDTFPKYPLFFGKLFKCNKNSERFLLDLNSFSKKRMLLKMYVATNRKSGQIIWNALLYNV